MTFYYLGFILHSNRCDLYGRFQSVGQTGLRRSSEVDRLRDPLSVKEAHELRTRDS